MTNGSFNVLARHHQKNKTPCAPDLQALHDIRIQGQTNFLVPSDAAPNLQNSNNEKKAKHATASEDREGNGDPTQLKFYPPRWHDLLEHAKELFRCFLSNVNGFPSHEVGLQEAKDCINEALEEFSEAGKEIESSSYELKNIFFLSTLT